MKTFTAYCRANWFWLALILVVVAGYQAGKDYAFKLNKEEAVRTSQF